MAKNFQPTRRFVATLTKLKQPAGVNFLFFGVTARDRIERVMQPFALRLGMVLRKWGGRCNGRPRAVAGFCSHTKIWIGCEPASSVARPQNAGGSPLLSAFSLQPTYAL